MKAILATYEADRPDLVFALPQGRIDIGRDPGCQFQLPDPEVSRRHAEVEAIPGGWCVRDLGSSNGTRVNGQAAQSRRLAHGDRIGIGPFEIWFLLDVDAEAFQPSLRIDLSAQAVKPTRTPAPD